MLIGQLSTKCCDVFLRSRFGSDCGTSASNMHNEGEGELCEAGVWEARRTEAFSNESSCRSAADTRCWCDVSFVICLRLYSVCYTGCTANSFKDLQESVDHDALFSKLVVVSLSGTIVLLNVAFSTWATKWKCYFSAFSHFQRLTVSIIGLRALRK